MDKPMTATEVRESIEAYRNSAQCRAIDEAIERKMAVALQPMLDKINQLLAAHGLNPKDVE